ncbi:glycosyltransferase [Bacteroides gallinaceum]|uniref:Glycosyltransferase n=1 Tax=Bacteroides gallinaceum TaxID=1462571 RepID=A0ABT7X6A7_9BACE|nr:glycosyltransferase [Bacteroides gallinaceum]MDN0049597.1 glycosyltransferase [Bacteroides gallinaceum]
MNILFYTEYELSPTKGGTERITSTIAMKLHSAYGMQCYSIYTIPLPDEFEKIPFMVTKQIPLGQDFENILYDFVKTNNIDIIVNQGAFNLSKKMRHVLDRFNGKYLISVLHFNPGVIEHHPTLHSLVWNMKQGNSTFKNCVKLVLLPFVKSYRKRKGKEAYHEGYICSDRVVLLSDNFRKEFKLYANLKNTDKIVSIHNALSFNTFFDMSKYNIKKKELLIVSRLDETQKRISLALRIWSIIEQQSRFNDWNLTIVGHGEEYETEYKNFVRKNNLQRVSFEGRQNPEPYYYRASIFLMTSLYEGWGLTLTEAQQYGVVPIAFNSYASLTDIITDGENGFIIPNNDLQTYIDKLADLMQNENKRKYMAVKAIESSKRFCMDKICADWIALFKSLNN